MLSSELHENTEELPRSYFRTLSKDSADLLTGYQQKSGRCWGNIREKTHIISPINYKINIKWRVFCFLVSLACFKKH